MNLQSTTRIGIKPKEGKQYNNTLKVGDKELIVSASIEHASDTQRIGIVFSLPINYKGELQINDEVVVQHNVFRISYNHNGIPMQSNQYIKDDMFFVDDDLIYLYIRDGIAKGYQDNVFVEPFKEIDKWEGEKEVKHQGKVFISNNELKAIGVNENDKIQFRMNCEYEFNIFGKRLYKMKNNRVLCKIF